MEAEEFQRALAVRPDYLAAEQQVKAAELRRKAAQAERLPSLGISGDYGVIGTHPEQRLPHLDGQRRTQDPHLRGRQNRGRHPQGRRRAARRPRRSATTSRAASSRTSPTPCSTSPPPPSRWKWPRRPCDYAQQTLTQSQDRFSAGVTNNIEVIQAQEAVANANQQFIASLFSHNIAKVLLARAVGTAEQSVRRALEEDSGGGASGQNPPGAGANGAEQPPAASGAPAPAK